MYKGLSHAAWGYLLVHFDFELNGVSVLPRFAGYLLLLSAIGKLSEERRDLKLLRPLCILLSVWNGADWLLSWLGGGLDDLSLPLALGLIAAVAGLYFHFQFLTDMAAIAETWQSEGDDLDRRLRTRRTVYIVLSTVTDVLLYLPIGRDWEWRLAAVTVLAVIGLALALFIMWGLFQLRRLFREEEPDTPDV